MSTLRTGIVGVGQMGGRMANRVREAGDPIVAYDRDASRLASSGISPVGSLEELVTSVDVVLLSLPDSSIIEPVMLGEGGVLEHARPRQVVVDLSTASPSSTRRIHEALADQGVAYLDAGISGGAKAADAGTLTIMVGGDALVLDRVRPILERFAAKIFHMGESGAGHIAKLLNNFLNGISLAATAEVMVAAKLSGLDLETFLDVVNASSGVNFATLNRFPHIIKGDYLEGGLTGRLMAKDIRLYLEHVARLGVPTFNGPACLAAFEVANALGYEDQISNRVVDGIGDLAGGVRLQDSGGTT
ncbi:MAG TPA: NAD(P)-dependent oxidoreductase [Solirubrobacteraceae bacterium]|nr:NAD(P)-dependent oxidoreductase [Solirubrobacteraceae bacterium]